MDLHRSSIQAYNGCYRCLLPPYYVNDMGQRSLLSVIGYSFGHVLFVGLFLYSGFLVWHYNLMADYQIINYILFSWSFILALSVRSGFPQITFQIVCCSSFVMHCYCSFLFGYNSLFVDVTVSILLFLGPSFFVGARKVSYGTNKLISY